MKKSITIGIPAYNEDANIGHLLTQLLKQKQNKFVIDKIIVASDGSTDRTAEIVKMFNKDKVVLIDNKNRKGAWFVQNQIIKATNTELLVLLDADISINNPLFIFNLIKPILDGKADLTSCEIIPVPPKTLVEKMLYVSVLIKNEIYRTFKNGNSVYTCHGQARGFSKRLYKNFRFENVVSEDAFSYFYCIGRGLKYHFVSKANVFYKLPDNWKDHERQSIRFFKSQVQDKNSGLKNWSKNQYRIPLTLSFIKLLKYYIKFPIEVSLYLGSLLYIRIKSLFVQRIDTRWHMALSSKKL